MIKVRPRNTLKQGYAALKRLVRRIDNSKPARDFNATFSKMDERTARVYNEIELGIFNRWV